jgi:hypothetical protein
MPGSKSPRSPEFVKEFTQLWEAKTGPKWTYTTSDMGHRLGITKNTVCGLRKRLDLPERGTPLRGNLTFVNGKLVREKMPPRPRKPPLTVEIPGEPIQIPRARWLEWFNRLESPQKQRIAAAIHPRGCAMLASGGGMWECTCGLSLPGTALARTASKRECVADVPAEAIAGLASSPPSKRRSHTVAATRPSPFRRTEPCCWPNGPCDAEAVPGKPYCVEHWELTHQKSRQPERQEAAHESA